MALSRAAGLCRLALRTQWAAVRLLSYVGAGGEPPGGDVKPVRLIDTAALRRERAPRPPLVPPSPQQRIPAWEINFNAQIQACASPEAVLDLVTPQLHRLSPVNANTALSTIWKRASLGQAATWLQHDARFAQLLECAARTFERMQPRNLSSSLYACAKLGITPPAEWLQRYWHASAALLGEFVPQSLSNVLYACGQLGIAPPADWLQRYWYASALKLGEFNEQDLSNTVYACGQLGISPPADWLQRFWHANALKLGGFKPQGLSNTMYACGQLGISPPAELLQRFWHASASKLGEFKPQELSNTMYACGQLDITPPADWLQRFWDASALKLGELVPQNYSNTLHACGQLGIMPPADWLQRFWHASASKLGEFSLQNLSNTLFACSQLGITPPADWLCSFCDSIERLLPHANLQDLSNTTLALATLGLWEPPLWPGLWERLCHALPRDSTCWNAETQLQAQQLYQAYQAATLERPGLLSAPDPELLAAARKSWIDGMVDTSSKLHAEVSACLTRMGVAHANERWCERAERRIDIAIEDSGRPIALEVDGPYHFLQDGRPDGSTRLRNRMLAAHGWRVAVVDYRAWDGQKTQAQRDEYLRRLLAA